MQWHPTTCLVSNFAACSPRASLSECAGTLNTALSVSKLTAALWISGLPIRMRLTAAEQPPHFIPETSRRTASVAAQLQPGDDTWHTSYAQDLQHAHVNPNSPHRYLHPVQLELQKQLSSGHYSGQTNVCVVLYGIRVDEAAMTVVHGISEAETMAERQLDSRANLQPAQYSCRFVTACGKLSGTASFTIELRETQCYVMPFSHT